MSGPSISNEVHNEYAHETWNSHERDHMLELIAQFNMTEVLGAEIKLDIQVDMALETLPEIFSQFKVNYNINKMKMFLTELMKEFENVEATLKAESDNAFYYGSC
jgi:hypothetical protein